MAVIGKHCCYFGGDDDMHGRHRTHNEPWVKIGIRTGVEISRFEETDTVAAYCDGGDQCIGGYARLVTKVKNLMQLRNATNPIFLNAGDNFQGTLWYTIGLWNVTQHFLNMLPSDAMTLGNHEFDHGIEGVIPFLEKVYSPVVVCNIDDRQEPSIQGKYKKSIVIEKYSKKIGIIGVILQTTDNPDDNFKQVEVSLSMARALKTFEEHFRILLADKKDRNENNIMKFSL